jgi:hypothetical protein
MRKYGTGAGNGSLPNWTWSDGRREATGVWFHRGSAHAVDRRLVACSSPECGLLNERGRRAVNRLGACKPATDNSAAYSMGLLWSVPSLGMSTFRRSGSSR